MTFRHPAHLYVGHDDDADVDYLLTIWDDDNAELASRPGKNLYGVRWGAPVQLKAVREC